MKADDIKHIKEKYEGEEELDKHFVAPRLPEALWEAVQNDFTDSNRLKAIHKVQNNMFLALKPLLSVLEHTTEQEKADQLTEAIQLICSSNLDLNKFRRVMVARHLRPQLRKQILNLPVTHDSCFGEDFSKATETIINKAYSLVDGTKG